MAEDVTVRFGASIDGLVAGAKGGAKAVREFGETVEATKAAIAGIGEALIAAFAVREIIEFAKRMGEAAEKTEQLSQRLGMNVTEVEGWKAVMTASGHSIDELAGSTQRLVRSLALAENGGRRQAAAFEALGLSTKRAYSTNELLLAVAEKFHGMDDGPRKIAIAMDLMGRNGAVMIPVLNMGVAGIKKWTDEAYKMGATFSQNNKENERFIDLGMSVQDSLHVSAMGFQGVANILFAELGPAIRQVIVNTNDLIARMIASYRAGGDVATAMYTLGQTFKWVVVILGTVAEGFYQLYLAIKLVADIATSDAPLWDALGKALKGDFAGAAEGMKTVRDRWTGDYNALKDTFKDFPAWVKQVFNPPAAGGMPRPLQKGGGEDLSGLGGKPPAKEKSQMAEFEAQLREQEIKEKQYFADRRETELAFWQEKLKTVSEKSKDYGAIEGKIYDLEKSMAQSARRDAIDAAAEQVQLAKSREDAEESIESAGLTRRRQILDEELAAGRITQEQRARLERDVVAEEVREEAAAEDRKYQIEAEGLRAKLALLTQDKEAQAVVRRDIEQLEAEHQARLTQIEVDGNNKRQAVEMAALNATRARYQNAIGPIVAGWRQGFQGMIDGTMTWRQAMFTLMQSVENVIFDYIEKQVAQWFVGEAMKTAGTVAGETERLTIKEAGATAEMALNTKTATSSIFASAAKAAAGAYAAIAGIPIVGPFLAPAVAAGALIAVTSLVGKLFSAEGGMDEVPGGGAMTQLHPKEMVLSAKYAEPLRRALAGAGLGPVGLAGAMAQGASGGAGGGGSGLPPFTYAPTINAAEPSLEELVRKEPQVMRRWLSNEIENGTFKRAMQRAAMA